MTYATYELIRVINVFCFSFCLHYNISLSQSEYSKDLIMAQPSSTLAAGNLISGFQTK